MKLTKDRYKTFSSYLKKRYGCKTYKIPINIKGTCPNRDGNIKTGGCIFCGEEAAGYETLSNEMCIKEQYKKNREYIGNRYNVKYFIPYLQNYTNTYMSDKRFEKIINQFKEIDDNMKAIYISTRPDCVSESKLDFLRKFKEKYDIDIIIELGLQTANYKTLKILNRGHSLSNFIWTVKEIKKRNIEVCAHVILDLPWDDKDDVIETANVLNALEVDQVKCHSLYILEDTVLGDMYKEGEVKPIEYKEYLERTVSFIRHIDKNTIIQRLVARAPKERTLFCNHQKSWWKIKDEIVMELDKIDAYQGDQFFGFEIKKLKSEY